MKLTTAQRKNIQTWIDALLSGDYKQGRQYLCAQGKYCCLGVAAEIKGVPSAVNGEGIVSFLFPCWRDSRMVERDWFEKQYGDEIEAGTLSSMNDGADGLFSTEQRGACTFEEIACMLQMYLAFDLLAR